jgi:hypothetical protein
MKEDEYREPNPLRGSGRRKDPTSMRGRDPKMTRAQLEEMFLANGIKFSTHPEDAGLGMGSTYGNADLDQRTRDGYYNDLDTPEDMLGRVRRKMAGCAGRCDSEGIRMGDSIVEVFEIHGMMGLSAEQKAWIPKSQSYAERRKALEAKIAPQLAKVAASVPESMAKELDDEFQVLLDGKHGTNKNPTKRKGLLGKAMAWLHGEVEHVLAGTRSNSRGSR